MTQEPRSHPSADARSDAPPRPDEAGREASGALPFGAGVESSSGEHGDSERASATRPSSRKKRTKRKDRRKPRSESPSEKAEEPQERGATQRRKSRSRSKAPREAPEEESEEGEVRVWKKFRLSAFQVRAIDAIAGGHNVLVAAPTGAGKTLVAEYAIEDAVRRGKRCIYTAPIKALSNQKYRDFRDDPEIDVGLMTGDVTIRPEAQVLIMTTEILRNAIFENPEYLSEVEFAIFDEVHFLDDPERGSVWEECLIFAPKTVRVICLSATIDNLEEVGDWLTEIRDQEVHVVRSDKRPVPLTHRFWTAGSGMVEPREIGRLRKTEGKAPKKPSSRGRSRHGHGPTSNSRRDKNNERSMRRKERLRDERPPSLAPLLDELQAREWMPTLVFCFSRKECEYQAHDNLSRELLNTAEKRQMEALQRDLIELFDLPESAYDSALFAMARRGIAYHHAGMLPAEKEFVERLFTTGTVKLLFATETFAVGINMPARCVVFRSLRKFDGVSFDYMRTRDYLQMAGRAGRQGIDDEGLVFSVLAPKDLREAPIERFLEGRSEPVKSRFGL
ncbi:MAG: DEAD/DEAH box helicase, partial [Planctomycetota bacterium]